MNLASPCHSLPPREHSQRGDRFTLFRGAPLGEPLTASITSAFEPLATHRRLSGATPVAPVAAENTTPITEPARVR